MMVGGVANATYLFDHSLDGLESLDERLDHVESNPASGPPQRGHCR